MVVAPNALSPRVAPYSDDLPTQAIPRIAPVVTTPRMLLPFLMIMVPALVLAVVAGVVAGPRLAPVAGAVIGVAGAGVALWFAIRRANRR